VRSIEVPQGGKPSSARRNSSCSHAALESADSFESQGGQDLWQRLLKVATTHSMGALDRYLSSLLAAFPVETFAAAALRFSFALDLKLPVRDNPPAPSALTLQTTRCLMYKT
jgi:hypothetical protein